MELLQELEVWYVIPTIRKELALALKNQGIKQVEIAKKLGLTKAAVTQYLQEKRGNEIKFNNKLKEEVNSSSKRINTEFDAVREIQYLINLSRQEKIACQIHKNMDSNYKSCNVCFEKPLIKIGERK